MLVNAQGCTQILLLTINTSFLPKILLFSEVELSCLGAWNQTVFAAEDVTIKHSPGGLVSSVIVCMRQKNQNVFVRLCRFVFLKVPLAFA